MEEDGGEFVREVEAELNLGNGFGSTLSTAGAQRSGGGGGSKKIDFVERAKVKRLNFSV